MSAIIYTERIFHIINIFFNVDLDETGEPILCVGKCCKDHVNKKIKCSQKTHFNLMLTSIKLMRYVKYDGVFHIDGTHGIVKNRFPLDVFAITDRNGTLHPIAFMLTSFETQYDFERFYLGKLDVFLDNSKTKTSIYI